MIISAVGDQRGRGLSPEGRRCLSPLLTLHRLANQVCIQVAETEEEVGIPEQ